MAINILEENMAFKILFDAETSTFEVNEPLL